MTREGDRGVEIPHRDVRTGIRCGVKMREEVVCEGERDIPEKRVFGPDVGLGETEDGPSLSSISLINYLSSVKT